MLSAAVMIGALRVNNTYPTWAIAHPNNSGLWFTQAPTSNPPLEPPLIVILKHKIIAQPDKAKIYGVIYNQSSYEETSSYWSVLKSS